MLIGFIIAALIVCGLIVAFAAVLMFWIVMAVFWVSTFALAWLAGDPYLGFFLAFPLTALIFWVVGSFTEKPSASKN